MIAASWHLDTFADVWGYVAALICCFLVGGNVAFIIWAREIFPKETCRFWKWFFVGKSFLSATLALELIVRSGPISWRTPLTFIGASISLYALVIIYHDRPYKPFLSAAEEKRRRERK